MGEMQSISALDVLEQNLFIIFAIDLLNVGISLGGVYGRDVAILGLTILTGILMVKEEDMDAVRHDIMSRNVLLGKRNLMNCLDSERFI